MKKLLVRRLGVASVAKFVGVAQAIWAFIAGFFIMFGGIASVATHDEWDWVTKVGGSIGVALVSLILVPLFAFLAGWVYGAVVSLIANLFLHTSKGIEIDVEEEK